MDETDKSSWKKFKAGCKECVNVHSLLRDGNFKLSSTITN